MDLQPSGNKDELIFVETERVYFTLKGKEASTGTKKSLFIFVDGKDITVDNNEFIYLKEYTDYEIIIESKSDSFIEFDHDNINIRNKLTPTGRTGKLLSGIINFSGDIGYSDLYVKVDGRIHLKVTLEVMPSKLDYKEDYEAILEDVNEEIYNLAYGFLARTYLGTEINNRNSNTPSEFYSIFTYIYEKLIRAVNLVIANPHHELMKESSICKYHMLKNTNKETLKWLEKRTHLLKKTEDGYIPREALQVRKTITYDTRENRFLKFILLRITDKLRNFLKIYTRHKTNPDSKVINKLNAMEREINKKLNTSFLKDIGRDYINTDVSLVFIMAAGYKEIYKYYLMLQKGLSINNNILNISIKELSLLYEYWCFIKINSLLQKKYKLITADFIKVYKDGLFISLKKGETSTLKYENPETKEEFEVTYNSKKGSKTVAQKPDNVFGIHKRGSKKTFEFVFDAKYKIDTTYKYCKDYGGIGPKEEDINTMHRYRDAIIYNSKAEAHYENCIFGAFVLFPYKAEEQYRKHKFYKSIEEVNIGGLPFLPSSTKLMKEFLDKLIKESSYSTFERAIDTMGREEYIKDEDFKDRTVLVGSLKNKEQLDINLKGKFYHTPCKNVNLAGHNIKYIALAQSINNFHEAAGITYYGAVDKVEVVKRKDITEIPKNSDENYYVFRIKEWKQLKRKIEVSGYNVMRNIYTSEFLLNNASIVTELCIKSKEEYRLWTELKRFNKNAVVKSDKGIDEESFVKGFTIEDVDITIDSGEIVVGDGSFRVSVEEFRRKPRVVMQGILERVKVK